MGTLNSNFRAWVGWSEVRPVRPFSFSVTVVRPEGASKYSE